MAAATSVHSSGFVLSPDSDRQVGVWKVYTRKGERLEIVSTRLGTETRLDALALESTTWQAPAVFEDELDIGDVDGADRDLRSEVDEIVDEIRIANEFAEVSVSRLHSNDGIEINSKLGYSIQLSVSALEMLSYQEPDLYSEFLTSPFGPSH
jgi:hypothetical protein